MKKNPVKNQIKTRLEIVNKFDNEKNKTSIQNKDDDFSTDLILYGDIGEDFWGEGITAAMVRLALKRINTDIVNVHINSYGGDVFEGLAIYNVFKQSEKTINCFVDGIAASAASIIFMGGNKRYMPRNTQLMIHNAQTGVWGFAEDFEKAAATLNSVKVSLQASYMDKFEGTEEELIRYLDNETFFTAEDAVGVGLADEILQYDIEAIEENNSNEDEKPETSNTGGKIAAKNNLLENLVNVFAK